MKGYWTLWSALMTLGLLSACGNQNADKIEPNQNISPQKLYINHCSICHGDDGKLGFSGARDLTQTLLSQEEVIAVIKYGSKNGKMRAFGKDAGGELGAGEIKQLSDYLQILKKKNE